MKRIAHLLCLIAWSSGDCGQAGCLPTGYLSVIGPSGFRYQDPELITVKRPLPPFPVPIVVDEPPKSTNAIVAKVEMAATNAPTAVVTSVESGPPATAPAKVEPPAALIESSSKENQIINPTVLLKFFNGNKTNSNAQGTAVPIGFTLPSTPAPVPPASSTATFSTSP